MSQRGERRKRFGKIKNLKTKKFFGSYNFSTGERIFNLKEVGGKRLISFESWQMAKKLGWNKIYK
jgi:hypothetical protein